MTTTTTKRPRTPKAPKPLESEAKPKRHSQPFPALEPGKKYSIILPDWRPATYNQLHDKNRWVKAKLKKRDRDMVWFRTPPDFRLDPERPVKRRVSLLIVLGKGQRECDVDAFWKSTLDALKHAGVIYDDKGKWCETGGDPKYTRTGTKDFGTIITIEDI